MNIALTKNLGPVQERAFEAVERWFNRRMTAVITPGREAIYARKAADAEVYLAGGEASRVLKSEAEMRGVSERELAELWRELNTETVDYLADIEVDRQEYRERIRAAKNQTEISAIISEVEAL